MILTPLVLSCHNSYPVTIRLLDPPLHEFLPNDPKEVKALAARIGKDYEEVGQRRKRPLCVNVVLTYVCPLQLPDPSAGSTQD